MIYKFYILNFIIIRDDNFFDLKGSPLEFFKTFETLQYLLGNVCENSFLEEFLILLTIVAQKVPTLCPMNFVKVGKSLQLGVISS